MSKINEAIPEQVFELARTQIGAIIATELANQASLIGNEDLNATVWEERVIAFDVSELPAISVTYTGADSENSNTRDASYVHKYNIDVHVAGKASENSEGDYSAQITLQRIVGLIRTIIMFPDYKKLNIDNVETRNISGISIADMNKQDTNFIGMARLTLDVRVTENNTAQSALLIGGGETSVELAGTDEGYKFEFTT